MRPKGLIRFLTILASGKRLAEQDCWRSLADASATIGEAGVTYLICRHVRRRMISAEFAYG